MSDFINNPDKGELIENLNLAQKIKEFEDNGYDIKIKNGEVYYEDKVKYQNKRKIS